MQDIDYEDETEVEPTRWYHFELGDPRTIMKLVIACVVLLYWDAYWLKLYHKTPADVYQGVRKYGLVSLVQEGVALRLFGPEEIPPIRLSDPANFHISCGPECREKGRAK